MNHHLLIGLSAVIVIGIAAQWLAWRLKLPAILLLLLAGFLAGPLTGFLNPDEMFGPLLFPTVSLAVAIILFEGGLTLKFAELRGVAGSIRNLITVGALVTWAVGTLAAYFILGFSFNLALLIGAILIVTGPTVIGPLLRQVRPRGQSGNVLKWEGILIDPIGATLAVLVFEGILIQEAGSAAGAIFLAIVKTILIGAVGAAIGAAVLVLLLKRYWIPDYLQSSVTLMVVLAAFTASNVLQEESGLLTVTLLGVFLANQRTVHIHHIIEFKENLRVLLLSGLFIVLAARINVEAVSELPFREAFFLATMILVARPLSVFISTLRSELTVKERVFIASIAPRGIVAAAVSSVFALRLQAEGIGGEQAALITPTTFIVIVGTVAIYGLLAMPIAKRLGLAIPNPQGIMFAGAHSWARKIGAMLKEEGFDVMMVDTNWQNISAARMEGLRTYYGNGLSEHAEDEMDLGGVGRMIAVTPNDVTNSLLVLRFGEILGRQEVYQLPPEENRDQPRQMVAPHLRGRQLFQEGLTYAKLTRLFLEGRTLKKTRLTEEFNFRAYLEHYSGGAVPMFLIDQNKRLRIFTINDPPRPTAGHTIIGLVPAVPPRETKDREELKATARKGTEKEEKVKEKEVRKEAKAAAKGEISSEETRAGQPEPHSDEEQI